MIWSMIFFVFSMYLPDSSQAASRHLPDMFQTPSKHHPDTFQNIPDTFQTPFRHISDTFKIPAKHLTFSSGRSWVGVLILVVALVTGGKENKVNSYLNSSVWPHMVSLGPVCFFQISKFGMSFPSG